MKPSASSRVVAVVAALALVTVLVAASGVLGRGVPGSPTPSGPPASAPPTSRPTTPPSQAPSPPSQAPDGVFDVDLKNLTGDRVSVRITDATGAVVDATSGNPGDGMSVRWFDSIVRNVDADTLEITFVGLPRDEQVRLSISEQGGALHLDFVQAAPPANSDAVGFDRVLVIDFAEAVSADATKVTFSH